MASPFPRHGVPGPPLGGNAGASCRARRASSSKSGVSRRSQQGTPTRSFSRVVVLAGGATASVMCAAGVAHAEYVKPSGRGLEDTLVDDEMGGEDGVKAKMSKTVAFYDLDHTIIDTNSNKHWITTEIKNGRVTFKLIVTAVYWFAKYAMGNGEGAEVAGAEAAMAYAGKSSADLKKEVVAVFDAHLKHRMRPGCGPSMATHRQRNERIVICTSSWQYAAQYAAELFGCETDSDNVLSSVMEEKNGKLTGAIAEIAYGDGKYLVTKKWCDKNGIDLNDCYFYSDSMSDVKLLEMVGHPVVVNPDPRLRKRAEERGWPIEDWGAAPEKQANLSKKKGMRFF
jgi:HAD superfamily hydrolase (TIGR01490 family)